MGGFPLARGAVGGGDDADCGGAADWRLLSIGRGSAIGQCDTAHFLLIILDKYVFKG